MRWTAEQVLELAPDPASARAAGGLASPARWARLGASERAVWGACQGSGKAPYQVGVDLAGPAFRCSCPSRKVPCKHVLGLLLLWSAGTVGEGPEPDWVSPWLDQRDAQAAAPRETERDEVAAQRRQARRADRVAAGVAELDGWLADQARRGLGTLERGGWATFAAVAARMVDAQAPGLAAGLRRAGEAAGRGRNWPSRVLEELGLLHLLVTAHARLGELPGPLADTVRARLGYTTDTAEVAASGERVADDWVVLGVIDQIDERLSTRRVWLHGLNTGRPALVLSFAPPGRPMDNSLPTGIVTPATLAFYPGAQPLRAVLAERSGTELASTPPGTTVAGALTGYAAALATDPWLERWPVLLADVTPVRAGDGWALVDPAGDALPLRPGADPWPLLAVSAGRPRTVGAEWATAGLLPLSCWDDDRPVRL
ncbi:MAG TPA: SWIM zinc finger family protein [Actinophytocola sp.]|uniref:SWIM zinc finger family protein n=1 Tax=Actinophytocola sp. TaxID=1872138 RepID=UPI002DB9AD75|nr:SWIM zinc finger family protein [Actinophytocola sp.]HEU5471429.1 SWIM zinc finger family protein [Actinophytocola sp.]